MASTKEYLDYVLDQLSILEEVSYRKMMGEYIIYYKGKIVGGIYDDRLLIKPVASAIELIADIKYELPYDGAKEMILVTDIDDKDFLASLFTSMYDELSEIKTKRKSLK